MKPTRLADVVSCEWFVETGACWAVAVPLRLVART